MNPPRSTAQQPGKAPDREDFDRRLAAALPALEGFAARLLRRTPLAQETADLVQETLARALHNAHSYTQERPIEPWLQGICVRLAADRFRARATAPLERCEAPTEHASNASADSEFEIRDEVHGLLRRLPRREREVLVEFHLAERSIAEIARRRAVPEGTVKSWLHRARQALAGRREPHS